MIDPLPGGIDDSAGYVYNRLKHKSDDDLAREVAAIQEELAARAEVAKTIADKARFPIKAKIYCHNDKESNWAQAQELGLSEEASRNFSYTALEVSFDVLISEDGSVMATHVNDVALEKPVEI